MKIFLRNFTINRDWQKYFSTIKKGKTYSTLQLGSSNYFEHLQAKKGEVIDIPSQRSLEVVHLRIPVQTCYMLVILGHPSLQVVTFGTALHSSLAPSQLVSGKFQA